LSAVDIRRKKVIEGAKSIFNTRNFSLVKEYYDEELLHYDLIGERPIKKGKKKSKMIIRIPDDDPVGVTKLREFKAYREENGFEEAILLALSKYTHYTKKEAEEAGIETFSIKFPFFDLFQHDLVPTHEFATEAEEQEIMDTYAIDVKQLPKILVQDPAIQLLGAKVGDVIKITRESPTAGAYVTYRYCIE
jgi:DNA-directed RNA polymerase subunit H (RpoH/RPB5)